MAHNCRVHGRSESDELGVVSACAQQLLKCSVLRLDFQRDVSKDSAERGGGKQHTFAPFLTVVGTGVCKGLCRFVGAAACSTQDTFSTELVCQAFIQTARKIYENRGTNSAKNRTLFVHGLLAE